MTLVSESLLVVPFWFMRYRFCHKLYWHLLLIPVLILLKGILDEISPHSPTI